MKLFWLELEQLTLARLSSTLRLRFATSDLTSTSKAGAVTLKALGLASASTTWKVVTGSKVYLPTPRDSKSYRGATVTQHEECATQLFPDRQQTFVLHSDGLAGGYDNEGGVIRLGEVDLHLDAREVGGLAILQNFERTSREVCIENRAVLQDLNVLRACVGDRGGDLDLLDGMYVRRCWSKRSATQQSR